MPDTTTTTATELRGSALFWSLIASIEASRINWDQESWREFVTRDDRHRVFPRSLGNYEPEALAQCQTAMCLAGSACDVTRGQWLLTISEDGIPLLAGQPVTEKLDGYEEVFLLAESDDDPEHIRDAHGRTVISAADRATRLFGITEEQADDLYAPHNTLPYLIELGERIFGARPAA